MFENGIRRIAKDRLADLANQWHQRFPNRRLEIQFGMGSECIRVDGIGYDLLYFEARRELAIVSDAVRDIQEITREYRDACPQDLVVEPKI
jgi:hypothetical protein